MIPAKRTSQLIFVSNNWEESLECIQRKWAEGFVVSSADYGLGHYCVVMDQGTEWKRQEILSTKDFPMLEINDYWDKHLDLSHVFHDKERWHLVFTGNTQANGQEWQLKNSFDEAKKFIQSLWKQNKFISAIYQHDQQYFVLMSGGKKTTQKWSIHQKVPENIMQGDFMKNLKMQITSMTGIDDKAFIAFSSNWNIREQFMLRSTDLIDVEFKLDHYWKQGFYVSNCAFVDEALYLVFSRF